MHCSKSQDIEIILNDEIYVTNSLKNQNNYCQNCPLINIQNYNDFQLICI